MKSHIALMAAALALTACRAGVDLTIFTSDIAAVAAKGGALDALATISIEASSAEKCAEARGDIQKALEKGFPKVEFVACRKAGMDTWADFRVPVTMTRDEEAFREPLGIGIGQADGTFTVNLFQNKSAVKIIIAALPEEIGRLVSGPLEPQVSVTIQNDLPGAAQITTHGMFVDGEPYQLPVTRDVARRAELRLVLSDVGNAALNGHGSYLFKMIAP